MRTTHVGSLPRPDALVAMLSKDEGDGSPPPESLVNEAVDAVVRRQVELGLDVVNDGEQGKPSYATYARDRLSGFEGRPSTHGRDDREDFTDFWESRPRLPGASNAVFPSCTGPVEHVDLEAVRRDIATVKRAALEVGVATEDLFLTAASPGLITSVFGNEFYDSQESYLWAVAEAMRAEYREIVDAGLTLQLDCPDLAGSYSWSYKTKGIEQFRLGVAASLEALDDAVTGLPPERLRLHVCWGNTESPHVHDLPFGEILDLLLRARPNGVSFEAANPRHAHEWRLFEQIALPEGKYLAPGVIDTTTNFVEHPEVVAERLVKFATLVGDERVLASCDCGFATFAGPRRVATSVVWAKLQSLVEGAALATKELRSN